MSKAFYVFLFAWVHHEEKKALMEATKPSIISGKGWAIIDGEYMEF